MKYIRARTERKMSTKRGTKHNATSTDGGGGVAACRCVGGTKTKRRVGGTKSKGHGESNDDKSNSKEGGLFGSSTMASNKRGLAGGADHES